MACDVAVAVRLKTIGGESCEVGGKGCRRVADVDREREEAVDSSGLVEGELRANRETIWRTEMQGEERRRPRIWGV